MRHSLRILTRPKVPVLSGKEYVRRERVGQKTILSWNSNGLFGNTSFDGKLGFQKVKYFKNWVHEIIHIKTQ